MSGIFYGIGVGPGDPELLTVKAVKIIKEAEIIIVPQSSKDEESVAFTIARPYIEDVSRVIRLVFPMVNEPSVLEAAWEKAFKEIQSFLEKGKTVAFLTLGDPMLYGTYIYIYRLLAKAGFSPRTIPGITSYSAAASRTGIPLARGDETLSIIPAAAEEEKVEQLIANSDNLVLMKAHKNLAGIIDKLQASGHLANAVMVSRCGYEDEQVFHNLLEIGSKKLSYFSTIIARKNK